jgi:hypothetical protein
MRAWMCRAQPTYLPTAEGGSQPCLLLFSHRLASAAAPGHLLQITHEQCPSNLLCTMSKQTLLCPCRYMPYNQPPPPPPRTRPPSAPSDPSGPQYKGAPPELPGRLQGQLMGGPAAQGHGHGHGSGQYEGHGQMQSFGAPSMGGTGYMPLHLRNRERVCFQLHFLLL